MPDMSLAELHAMLRRELPGKSRDRLMAAVQRKKGKQVDEIARLLGRAQGTISNWLRRLQDGGPERRHDSKSTGRPCKISKEQQEQLRQAVSKKPEESGFERGNWTSPLVATHILKTFGVKYSSAGALALAHRLNFSVRIPRIVHYKTVSKEEEAQYVVRAIDVLKMAVKYGFFPLCMDAAGFANAPSAKRGLYPKGGRETVKVSFSKKTKTAIGAIGENICYLHFCDGANSDNVIILLEALRKRFGKILVICDNAKAHKSKRIREYLNETRGNVLLWYLPPYTPQQNPIEILWREIKRAIAPRYFEGGFEQMQASIMSMLASGEVCMVRLFQYMLDAIHDAKNDDLQQDIPPSLELLSV